MSKEYTPQAAPNGVYSLARVSGRGFIHVTCLIANIPSAVAGYEKGCFLQALDPTNGLTSWYYNSGTLTSCTFTAFDLTSLATIVALTATPAELNTLHTQTISVPAGAGITGGTGTIYKTSVQKSGDRYVITLEMDLTGLGSSTTDLDIIGQGVSVAHIGQLSAAQAGATVHMLSMQCLEAPATGVTDIDVYSATEGTGKFDDAVTGLTETALITSGGAWTNGRVLGCTTVPLSTEFLYLTCGAAGTVGTYTAGKFRITIVGYD